MFNSLSRYSKTIAWFFTGILYVELLVASVEARANVVERRQTMDVRRETTDLRPSAVSALTPGSARNYSPLTTQDNKQNQPLISDAEVQNYKPQTTKYKPETGGPTQPEMQSFSSVNANNMVDLFTGDFSYNIPLLDVGGYPVGIHYKSGITMDQEASWVGLGWNINPGTISRNMRGLPDDFQGGVDKVTKSLHIKENRTIGVNVGGDIELFGLPIRLGVAQSIFHNTYKGWGQEGGLNLSINAGNGQKGYGTAGLSVTNNSQNGVGLNPSLAVTLGANDTKAKGSVSIGANYNSRAGIQSLQITGELKRNKPGNIVDAANKIANPGFSYGGGLHSTISYARPSYTPTISIPYTSTQFSYTGKLGLELWGLHPNFFIGGYGSAQRIAAADVTVERPAYGYLYYDKAEGRSDVLLDFNREKDVTWTDQSPQIGIPIYTYDTWAITGEGTGGMFRPYRNDIGFVYDHTMRTKSENLNISGDVGFGSVFHVGTDLTSINAWTETGAWLGDNAMKDVLGFSKKDSTYENVYFKNPGEKTAVHQQYFDNIGGDQLMRVDLLPAGSGKDPVVMAATTLTTFKNAKPYGKITFNKDMLRKERDKRTQLISFLTATDADKIGLDKGIRSYGINSFPQASCNTNYEMLPRTNGMRQPNHLSEITVLNSDGRRYIYGTPVYNVTQVDVNMSTPAGNQETGLVGYDSTIDNSVFNNRGKDAYFKEETVSPYAHAFLLSGIVSPEYHDITGDGITEDDPGDAVKFNYSRVYGENAPFKWRAPHEREKAFYDDGLKTDSRDEKGSYSYGTKEVWYLNSIESRTMIATFVLDDAERKDAHGVATQNGGRDAAAKLYRLKQINLYSKADYIKNGPVNAKPIKSVHFRYSYRLCKGTPDSEADFGKLTLDSIYFTYNKNTKGRRNPYVFNYHTNNPDFDSKKNDRWGNYKNSANNPGTTGGPLTNADYPYALQQGVNTWNKDSADFNAAAWTLTDIKLPSGGRIKVSYEADDYAWVQNRRAMQLFSLAGFGNADTSTPVNNLYPLNTSAQDYKYVFVNLTEQVTGKADITRKYLEGVDTLFFKIQVKVPEDIWGKGYETIPCYAGIEDYGVKGSPSDKKIWIKLKALKDGSGSIATTVLQFLRLNLPSKAYPYSEPGDGVSFRSFVGTLASMIFNFRELFDGYGKVAREKNYCNEVLTEKSFARLNNPVFRKFGGGLRVKKIEVFDHFHTMTAGAMDSAKYGQEYDYNTTTDINGVPTTISSGVATYEPMVGNEENPFRVPIEYGERLSAWAPVNYMYAEEPFAETFFPAPSVGYSKVRVQSIHKDKKSATGAEETEFFTAKDFPTIVEWTPLDEETKRRYKPFLQATAKIDAKHYITLSQGFKVELNDMHGELKSRASFSQNNLKDPISYTKNYYRLEKDDAGKPKLSNTVQLVDSANGKIRTGTIGKEVEVMVDMREQISRTVGGSLQMNFDMMNYYPPAFSMSTIPLPNFETNRYRSIAVLKIVNRYGMLDSVIHMEKGSVVSTRNKLYDSETGDVLLSETNNEFDDPVYNFSYPAHWAYSGMGPAYKNLGMVMKSVNFRRGLLFKGAVPVATERYFESGDEIWVKGNYVRNSGVNDYCDPKYHSYGPPKPTDPPMRIWAVEANKGKEGHKGIYFIDKNGVPFSGDITELIIVRSGRRNMAAASIGSVTSMQSPVKTVNGQLRLVFDSTINIIAAGAVTMKDIWRVDSTNYRKDTVMQGARRMYPVAARIQADGNYMIRNYGNNGNPTLLDVPAYTFEASSWDGGGKEEQKKSWLRFNLRNVGTSGNYPEIPKGAAIVTATLNLWSYASVPHENRRITNSSYIDRLKGPWPSTIIPGGSPGPKQGILKQYFEGTGTGAIDITGRQTIAATEWDKQQWRNDTVNVTTIVQGMVDDYYASKGVISPAIRISLVNPTGGSANKVSRLAYNVHVNNQCFVFDPKYRPATCIPFIDVDYCEPCNNGLKPASTDSGYYCYDVPIDTFICKPNINDTAVNPYRWGIFGNWRAEKAFTYYNRRKQSDPLAATNIRTDGEIKSFMPFWSFTDSVLNTSTDTSRWVWNSRMTAFNMKGFELENADPLGRYNAGQYGYNKTLPVAVGQNTKSREMAFDGFEDYNFKTDNCKKCLEERFVDFSSGGTLVDTVSHTGLYSLRLNGNQTFTKTIPIVTKLQDSLPHNMSLRLDSTAIIRKAVNGTGVGLNVEMIDYNKGSCTGGVWVTKSATMNLEQPPTQAYFLNCTYQKFSVRWKGYIQPKYTGMYTFHALSDERMQEIVITRNNVEKNIATDIIKNDKQKEEQWRTYYPTDTIYLQAGELYPIRILYHQWEGKYAFGLKWESEGAQKQSLITVPVSQLYPANVNTNAVKDLTVHSDTTWCVGLANAKPTKITNDRFSPLQGKKVVVSAWVKQQGLCINGNYDYVQLELQFNNAGPNYFLLKPRGNIIEGWQRIEDTLTIPANATSLSFSMKSTSSSPVYFDDIRIHPFNANMKSFVYNPVNLRLMAELDENNHATFYEYDDEGTLTRLKKETERGIKTLKETRSALLKE